MPRAASSSLSFRYSASARPFNSSPVRIAAVSDIAILHDNTYVRAVTIGRVRVSSRAGVIEACAFTGAVLVDIWFFHSRTRWGDTLPLLFAIVSFVIHRETIWSLGL